jgi:hypothetical protein
MTFRVATCEFPDRADAAKAMWRPFEEELDKVPVDLLVLPELAGLDSFWQVRSSTRTYGAAPLHCTLQFPTD